ncbi:MAG: 16S rRNA (adenine(1518)-N(6)/adenine(1519)-N(6))-dimethyltransferase RsmA [Candidatus Competibacteraceae bacterium]|nr:16S rRNA (adenine(1518)-N(6)/adenine(1519)-N(6))-dimethyltransferase RsmA [Candidatus Competibacteraceae bacterium]
MNGSAAVRPRKRFGQHFLHDPGAIQRILRAINPKPSQQWVEIGPGLGAITFPLLVAVKRLDVVELDRTLIPHLQERAQAEDGDLCIHNADALNFDFAGLRRTDQPLHVVGNLPYNIATPLLFHLLNQLPAIADMHFMLQKEVVDRLAAGPRQSAYGRLSVMVQYRCRVEPLFTLGAGAFRPPPKVESAFVRLIPHTQPPVDIINEQHFALLVRSAFGQRRKTVRNTLRGLLDEAALVTLGVAPSARPETLGLAEFAALSNYYSEATGANLSKSL